MQVKKFAQPKNVAITSAGGGGASRRSQPVILAFLSPTLRCDIP